MTTVSFSTEPAFVPIVIRARRLEEIEAETAAVRQDEVDAAQAVAVIRRTEKTIEVPGDGSADGLEDRSIDDLRHLASALHIPDQGKIIEKSELIAEIRRRM
jgi:hypothetical protein